METERIFGTDHRKNYGNALKRLAAGKDTFIIDRNKELTLKFLRDAEAGRTVITRQKKKIGDARLVKMYGLLRLMDNIWFRKAFDTITDEDMTNFVLSMERGEILSNKDKPYTNESQCTIKKFFRKYFKYLMGDNINYPKLVQYLDTSTRIAEFRAIAKEDVDRLIYNCTKLSHRFAIAFLFDSGARVAEFYNLKFNDITFEDGFYKARIRISKTRPRTVNLPLYTEIIHNYLAEQPDKNNGDAYVFTLGYQALKKMMWRLGKKYLNRNLYPHLLRHSSATYYAQNVSRYQLCYRFGWSASSKSPDRYVDMLGLIDNEILVKYKETETIKVQKHNEELNSVVAVLKSQMVELNKKQVESEIRAQIMKKEQFILSELFKSSITDNNDALTSFINSRPDIKDALRFIQKSVD